MRGLYDGLANNEALSKEDTELTPIPHSHV